MNFQALLPLAPALLIAAPGIRQRLAGQRTWKKKARLIAGGIAQACLIVLLARPGTAAWARMFSGLLLLAYSLSFAVDFLFFKTAKQPLHADMVLLGLRERRNFWRITRGYLNAGSAVFLCMLVFAVLLPVFFPATSGNPWFLAGGLGLAGLVLLGRRGPAPGEAIGALYRAVWCAPAVIRSSRPKKNPARRAFPGRRSGPPDVNILTIVNESLSRTLLYGRGAEAAPRLHAFLRGNGTRVFDFPGALCNSGTSDNSYPSIFTGLSLLESREAFETSPLIWSAAKAAGYHTSLFSAWNMDWAGLRDLIVDKSIDLFVDPEKLRAPFVNDQGMDDRILTREVLRHLAHTRKPLFTTVAYNAQHLPCMVEPSEKRYDLRTHMGRYLNSLTVLDECLGMLFDALEQSGQLERTVIFFLSDHGETPGYFDAPGIDGNGHSQRVDDLSHEILSVPFWMYLPPGIVDTAQEEALRANQGRAVSNLDYYPTAVSIMKLQVDDGGRRRFRPGGHDLLRPLPPDRHIACLNTGSLREWSTAPVALAADDELLIYHDLTRSFELINPAQMPHANAWPGAAEERKALWMRRVAEAGLTVPRRY